jgi:hypothetical protein
MQSSHIFYVIQSPSKMSCELGGQLKQVRRELAQLYGQRLEVRDIGLHFCAIAVELPTERRLEAYLN